MRLFILIIFLLSISLIGLSQSPTIIQYNIENGLAGNKIYSTYQDSKGYVWICTDNGLSKFDGIRFKNFNTNNGLPDNDLFNLVEDAKGRIWFACYNKAPVYIYNDEIYTRENDSFLKSIINYDYLKFTENKTLNEVYIGGSTKFYKIDHKGNIINEGLIIKKNFNGIIEMNSYNIFYNYLKIYLIKNDIIIDSFDINNVVNKNDTIISKHIKIDDKTFALIYKDRFYKYEISNHKIHFLNSNDYNNSSYFINNIKNQIWLSTLDKGLIKLDNNLKTDNQYKPILPSKISPNLYIDREGNKWIGTQNEGLFMIPNNSISKFNKENGLYKNEILNSYQFEDKILLNYGDEKIQYIYKNKIYDFKFSFPNNRISKTNHIFENTDAIAFAGDFGLIFQNKQTKKIFNLELGSIKCLAPSKQNTLLLGNSNSAIEINLQNAKINTVFIKKRTTAICEDDHQNIWIGGINGIVRYNRFTKNIINDSILGTLVKYRITDIKYSNNTLYIATVQNGIYILRNNILININKMNGLSDNNCNKIHLSLNNTIWIATNSGINKIMFKNNDISKFSVQIIDRFSGIQTNSINNISEINDTLYISSAIGLLIIPSNFPVFIDTPVVYISEIHINNKLYNSLNNSILKYNENNIDLYLSAISFRSLGNILFKYRIKGYLNNWQESKNNFLSFKNIPPGKYTIEVKAKNSQGVWSTNSAYYSFTINPAWWQSTWFYFFTSIIIICLIYILIRWRLKVSFLKKSRKQEINNQVLELELKAIKAQINPHFIFNSLNSIQYFINNNDIEEADNQLTRLSSLIRKTLDYSGKSTIKLNEEIEYIKNYIELEKVRFYDQFYYEINNEVSDTNNIEIPPMVLQPHIENAIKHGLKPLKGMKKLDIRFIIKEHVLICEIEDNGIGRGTSILNKEKSIQLHESKGMKLSSSKLELYYKMTGKKINTEIIDLVNDDQTKGTLVRIKIEL